MPTVSEIIKGLLFEKEESKKKMAEIARQLWEEKRRELERCLELNKKAIELIQPEQVLSELSVGLLGGKVVKEEGFFIHDHMREEGSRDDIHMVEYPYTHAVSSVSLLWVAGERGQEEYHRLMVAVDGEKLQYRAGGVFWNWNPKAEGYPDVLRLLCFGEVTSRHTKFVPFEIQNLEDGERLRTTREQIRNGIVSIFSELIQEERLQVFPKRALGKS